jgi:hypothetical protein
MQRYRGPKSCSSGRASDYIARCSAQKRDQENIVQAAHRAASMNTVFWQAKRASCTDEDVHGSRPEERLIVSFWKLSSCTDTATLDVIDSSATLGGLLCISNRGWERRDSENDPILAVQTRASLAGSEGGLAIGLKGRSHHSKSCFDARASRESQS